MHEILESSYYQHEGEIYSKKSQDTLDKVAKLELLYTDKMPAQSLNPGSPYDLMLLELTLCSHFHELGSFSEVINGLCTDFERTLRCRLAAASWFALPKRAYYYRNDINYAVYIKGSNELEVP